MSPSKSQFVVTCDKCNQVQMIYKIPKIAKSKILEQLALVGIDDGFIYSDKLHVSKSILRNLK